MKRLFLAALALVTMSLNVSTVTAQEEEPFINEVAVIYHTLQCVRVPWEDFKVLDNGKNYLVVITIHQATSPPTPPSILKHTRDDPIYFRNTPRGLVFGKINLRNEGSVESIDRVFFGNDFSFASSVNIPPVLRREATENSVVVYTFPTSDPNYETFLAQALAIDPFTCGSEI